MLLPRNKEDMEENKTENFIERDDVIFALSSLQDILKKNKDTKKESKFINDLSNLNYLENLEKLLDEHILSSYIPFDSNDPYNEMIFYKMDNAVLKLMHYKIFANEKVIITEFFHSLENLNSVKIIKSTTSKIISIVIEQKKVIDLELKKENIRDELFRLLVRFFDQKLQNTTICL